MTIRALIVDDNRALAEDLGEILGEEGYEVRVFDDPMRALAEAGDDFDVALLDMRMPGLDGVDLHERLAARCPQASFILMTAYTEDARIAQALAAGVRCVLTKPVPLPELLGAIQSSLDEPGEVLLIDDDASFRESLSELLGERGYRVRAGGSIAEARRLFASGVQASILDVRLPDGDGLALGMELCKASKAPVVLISGYDFDPVAGLPSDRARLLVKPFPPEALLEALSQLRGARS